MKKVFFLGFCISASVLSVFLYLKIHPPLLPEDKLVAVLIDLHLTSTTFTPKGDHPHPHYEAICRQHHVDYDRFQASLTTYLKNPEKMHRLYKGVVDGLYQKKALASLQK